MTDPVKNQLTDNLAKFAAPVTITNLYNLIGALNKKIETNHDNLITTIVVDLIGAGKIKWMRPCKKFNRFDC